jgi:beta-lactamase class A
VSGLSLPLGTSWSVAAGPVDGPPEVSVEPDLLLPTASVAKVLLLVVLAEQLEAGVLSADLPVDRRRVPPVADSGLWQHLAPDVLPLDDVAQLVGSLSDNWGTNVLLDLVGLETVQDRARDLAPGGSMLLDVVRDERLPTHPPTLSTGCASDWFPLMSALATGDGLGRKVSLRVLEWLRHGVDLSMVPSAFALDPLAHGDPDRGLRVFCKTGTSNVVRADVGVVTGPQDTWAYAAIASWDPAGPDRRDEVLEAMRSLGTTIREAVGG